MKDIDDKIRQALRAEDADLFDEVEGEQSLHQMVMETFRGRKRWIVLMAISVGIMFMGLAVLCAVQFFGAETTKQMIAWSIGFVFAFSAVTAMKVWYWMELNKNAIKREIKRLELQIARLAGRLPG